MSDSTDKLKVLFDWIITPNDSKFIDLILLNEKIKDEHKLQLASWIPSDKIGLISDCINHDISDDIKEHIIENIDFTFGKFSEVKSQYFKQLDLHNRVKPTWNNVSNFYIEIAELPIQMVNNHYITLSKGMANDFPNNIEEQKEALFFYNNELEIEAYKSYIPVLEFNPTDLTQVLNWDKILFLSECDLLNVSETTISQLFSQLHGHDEEQNHQLIITMLEKYINFNQLVDDNLNNWLLENTYLQTNFCRSLFKLNASIELQTTIFKWLLLENINWEEGNATFASVIPIHKNLLFEICQSLESDELKNKLINVYFETITNNDPNYIRQFFALFSNEEWKILSVNSSKWVKLEKKQDNQNLCEKLLKLGLISLLSDKQLKPRDTNENTIYFKNNLKIKMTTKHEDDEDFID
ncbi:hypothetical protein J7552_09525 [Wohlfahrtiimonas chitiniclastica]|nr:hypothetical protein [Wohlfahrtiimonas chitiniclastica]